MTFPLTATLFKAQMRAFADLDDDDVQPFLDEAEAEISETVWGDLAEGGHRWLTAHKLHLSGYGKAAAQGTTTSYGTEYERLQEQVGGVYRHVPD